MVNVTVLKGAALTYLEGLINTEKTRAQTAESGLQTQINGKAATTHTHTSSQIIDATGVGRSLLTAATAAAQRLALGLSSLAIMATTGTPGTGNFLRGDGAWASPVAPRVRQVFTASGTWTKPSGYDPDTMVFVQAWGGGGGGARSGRTYRGGGGGGYMQGWFLLSNLPATVAVAIGAGGAANANGGDTTFGALLTAFGGQNGEMAAPVSGGSPFNQFSTGTSIATDFDGGDGGASNGGGGASLYGGGGGAGAPGGTSRPGGNSVFGGNGGSTAAPAGIAPGGGGAETGAGARGELRIWL